jgi:hypothetical protein
MIDFKNFRQSLSPTGEWAGLKFWGLAVVVGPAIRSGSGTALQGGRYGGWTAVGMASAFRVFQGRMRCSVDFFALLRTHYGKRLYMQVPKCRFFKQVTNYLQITCK